MKAEELGSLTLPDLIIHPDPVIRWLIQQAINRFDDLEKEQEKKLVLDFRYFPPTRQ